MYVPHMLRKRPFEERAAFTYKHSEEGRQAVVRAKEQERVAKDERRKQERERRKEAREARERESRSERGLGSGSGSARRRVGGRRSMDRSTDRSRDERRPVSTQPLGDDNV